jgi:hypothetical protein
LAGEPQHKWETLEDAVDFFLPTLLVEVMLNWHTQNVVNNFAFAFSMSIYCSLSHAY